MASSCNSDNTESIMRRAANDNKSSREQERQERRPSSNPNRLEIAIAPRPSPNATFLANETRVMVKRSHDALGESSCPQSAGGGTTHKRPVGMTFSPLRPMIVSYPNPAFPTSTKDGFYDSLQPQKGQPAVVVEDNGKEQEAQGVEELAVDAAKARPDIYGGATTHTRPYGTTYRPFGRIICSYPNPEFPIFDPTRLTVNLPLDPPQPYSPTMSNKDASYNLQGEVVEDNAEQLATQGVEAAAAAAAAAKPRPDKQPCGATCSPFGQMICSYPNPEFPVFDPTRLTVDLSMDPPQPYSPLVSKRYGSENNLQPQKGMTEEVVEDNVKELATQGVEAAAAVAPAAPAKPRRDKRPRGTTYNPFGGIICSYPNPEFPIFDPKGLTVDLHIDPPKPYLPLVSKKDGSDDNLQPQKSQTRDVVEYNEKEQATQGGEAAAMADAEPRSAKCDDVVPVVRRYPVPDMNFPATEEDDEDEEN